MMKIRSKGHKGELVVVAVGGKFHPAVAQEVDQTGQVTLAARGKKQFVLRDGVCFNTTGIFLEQEIPAEWPVWKSKQDAVMVLLPLRDSQVVNISRGAILTAGGNGASTNQPEIKVRKMFIINVKSKTFPTSFVPAVKGEVVHVSKRKDLTQVPADVALELHNLNVEDAEKLPDGTAGGKVYDELWALLSANKETLDLTDPMQVDVKKKTKKATRDPRKSGGASKAAAKREDKSASGKKAAKKSGTPRGRASVYAADAKVSIVKKSAECPYREGTSRALVFGAIMKGGTVADVASAVERMRKAGKKIGGADRPTADLRNAIELGLIKVA